MSTENFKHDPVLCTVIADGVKIHQRPDLNSPAVGEAFVTQGFNVETSDAGGYVPDCKGNRWYYGFTTTDGTRVDGWVAACFLTCPPGT